MTFHGGDADGEESLSVSDNGGGLSQVGDLQQGPYPEESLASKRNVFDYNPDQSQVSRSNYIYQEQGVTTHGTIN